MEPVGVQEIEDLASKIAQVVERGNLPQTAEEAQAYARVLALLQFTVVEGLKGSVAEWTKANGPLHIDGEKDQAYGHWDKKTTVVTDEKALDEFLAARGSDPANYKRPDLVKLKTLLSNKEEMAGLEQFVVIDSSVEFGFKKNLLKNPKNVAAKRPGAVLVERPSYKMGPRGIVEQTQFVRYTPTELTPTAKVEPKIVTLLEEKVTVGCGAMPPAALLAKS